MSPATAAEVKRISSARSARGRKQLKLRIGSIFNAPPYVEAKERKTAGYGVGGDTRGSVIAIPTDTFYGLAADPFNLAAVDEIYRVKGRPETRALPILVNSIEQAILLAREAPRKFLRLAQAFWPGGLTLVVNAAQRIPLKVTAGTGRIALRWPNSTVVRRLIDEFEGPVTGTSANISGFPSCSNAEQVMKQLGLRVPRRLATAH